jgi:hypothetical protein
MDCGTITSLPILGLLSSTIKEEGFLEFFPVKRTVPNTTPILKPYMVEMRVKFQRPLDFNTKQLKVIWD